MIFRFEFKMGSFFFQVNAFGSKHGYIKMDFGLAPPWFHPGPNPFAPQEGSDWRMSLKKNKNSIVENIPSFVASIQSISYCKGYELEFMPASLVSVSSSERAFSGQFAKLRRYLIELRMRRISTEMASIFPSIPRLAIWLKCPLQFHQWSTTNFPFSFRAWVF